VRLAFVLTEVAYVINEIVQNMRLLLKDRLFDHGGTRHTNKPQHKI
jgi:hypothetical protein